MIKESITLKDLNTFAKENGLNEMTSFSMMMKLYKTSR